MTVSDIGGNKRIEPELFYRDSELAELTFVRLDHVGMRFTNLFEFDLNALDSFVLDVLYLVKSRANHTQSIGIDVGSLQDLVDRRFLGIEALLDSLELLLHDEISKTSLLVHLISESVELIEKVFLLCLEVLELLEFDFVLPLTFFVGTFNASDFLGADFEVLFDPNV